MSSFSLQQQCKLWVRWFYWSSWPLTNPKKTRVPIQKFVYSLASIPFMLFHSYLSFVAKCINLDLFFWSHSNLLGFSCSVEDFASGSASKTSTGSNHVRLVVGHHLGKQLHTVGFFVKCQTFSLVPLNCCFIACTSFLCKDLVFVLLNLNSSKSEWKNHPQKGQPNKESNMIDKRVWNVWKLSLDIFSTCFSFGLCL